MGQYRLSIWFGIQLGAMVRYSHGYYISVEIPFISINIGLTDAASGVSIFGLKF